MMTRHRDRRWHTASLLAVVALLGMATVSPVDAAPREIKGRVQVVDGDTLWLGRIKVRLNGIDAPERG
jgi:endonuclease YncB( thermonuclease family)